MADRLFDGRTALVTGGSRGIGSAISRMLGAQGARVAVNYVSAEVAAAEVVAAIERDGAEALAVQADVSRPGEVDTMVATVTDRLGPVDLLVNNAGMVERGDHGQLDFAGWKRMFEVNVDGPFLTTWAVKDGMIEREYGRIVNISSLAAVIHRSNLIHYSTAKSAVVAFTRQCADAFAPHVRVNCLAPGLIDTDMARTANQEMVQTLVEHTPLGRIGAPEDMAAAVQFLLSEESSFITGQTLSACGGRTLVPGPA